MKMTSRWPQDGASAPLRGAETLSFECTVPIRWSDQDFNGHVNNARVVTLMEEARILWLNEHAVAEGVENFTAPKVVVSLNVEYLTPVFHGSELIMEMKISRIGTRSFTISYVAHQDAHAVFRGSTVIVPVDSESGRPRTLVGPEIDYLTGYLVSPTVEE